MSAKTKHINDVITEFDELRFSEDGVPIDSGLIIQRPPGPRDKLIIRIDTGVAAGFEAFAMSEDFPGGAAHERVLFYARAKESKPIRFRLHQITHVGIRVRPIAS